MKGRIIYIKGHKESEQQAKDCLNSSRKYNSWQVELKEGITPDTLEKIPPIIENSRLLNFKKENENIFLTKISCVTNHINFWKEVVDLGEPMCFLEHDSICISEIPKIRFNEYLLLNTEYVFKNPSKLAIARLREYNFPKLKGVNPFPFDYPLTYYRENIWKGSFMAPGVAAYAVTPRGAEKLLKVADKNIDQADFIVNSNNIEMEYLYPSVCKFNNKNLSTSHGFQF